MRKTLVNKICNSSQYMRCIELYSKYISNLGEFVRENSIEGSSFAVSYFIDLLLRNGYFSIDHQDRYMPYEYDDYDVLENISASRVLTGRSVCRHKASFLADVLNCIGFDAYRVRTYYSNASLESLLKLDNRKTLFPNHLVTGIIDRDGKYMYDITGSDILFGIKHNRYVKSYRNNIGYRIFPLEYEDMDILEVNDAFYDSFSKDFDTDYIEFIKSKSLSFCKNNSSLFQDFYNENYELMNEIVHLYFLLIPYANNRCEYKKEIHKVKGLMKKQG